MNVSRLAGHTPPQVPDLDVIGNPTGPYGKTRTGWAVLVNCAAKDVPGPHLIPCDGEAEARRRLDAWQADRPDAGARVVSREVFECAGEWEIVDAEASDPLAGNRCAFCLIPGRPGFPPIHRLGCPTLEAAGADIPEEAR